MSDRLSVLRGTLDLLVLRALSLASMHGVEIIAWLDERAGGHLEVEESALYQALYRMESRQLVSADWGQTQSNRRARYYTITPVGRAQLRAEQKQWSRYVTVVTAILGPGSTRAEAS
jgi:transcriptional regulator